MAVGDCQSLFGEAAGRDGILLTTVAVAGLTDAGHLRLPSNARSTARLLETIFLALSGDPVDLERGAHRPLRVDWFHEPTSTVIEVDEFQHFTSDRLLTLAAYPPTVQLGFARAEYEALCQSGRVRADGYRSAKQVRGFRRPGGRRAQRAYFDAVRDLALPALGYPPVLRVPAVDGDGLAAYRRVRKRMLELVGTENDS